MTTPQDPRRQALMQALDRWVNQRPGLEFGNYGSVSSYRTELRAITRARNDYHRITGSWLFASIPVDDILKAAESAFSGRLTIKQEGRVGTFEGVQVPRYEGQAKPTMTSFSECVCGHAWKHHALVEGTCPAPTFEVSYCTGQYWPTEYRKAACTVVASAMWDYVREHCMPAPTSWRVKSWDGKEISPHMQIHAACALLESKGGREYGHMQEFYGDKKQHQGDWLRAWFKREFGRSIAIRWFD